MELRGSEDILSLMSLRPESVMLMVLIECWFELGWSVVDWLCWSLIDGCWLMSKEWSGTERKSLLYLLFNAFKAAASKLERHCDSE